MAITKPAVLPPWADTAGAGNITQPSNAQITAGWPLSATKPSRQWFNWVLNYACNGVRYMVRRGIPDWDAAETYVAGDRVQSANQCWRALAGSTGVTPVGNPASWEEFALGLPALNSLYGRLAAANTWAANQTIINAVTAFHALPLGQADGRYAPIGTSGIPTGTLITHGGGATPVGYLVADGAAVSRTTYAALYAQIGALHGAGDGSTTFNLPNGSGRTFIGAGAGSGLTVRTVGQTGGAETHTLSIAELPPHSHALSIGNVGTTTDTAPVSGSDDIAPETGATGLTGGLSPHNNMQPWFAGVWLIKT